jgi:hypothetical protein
MHTIKTLNFDHQYVNLLLLDLGRAGRRWISVVVNRELFYICCIMVCKLKLQAISIGPFSNMCHSSVDRSLKPISSCMDILKFSYSLAYQGCILSLSYFLCFVFEMATFIFI